ncbi:hypothetical protein, partial [Bacteroides cellulosilyticus]|uniref:hypothetical protein n=1 Tax=Bacteroides cellulosilyticus TaxID=246787 RepID=UPI0032EEC2A0
YPTKEIISTGKTRILPSLPSLLHLRNKISRVVGKKLNKDNRSLFPKDFVHLQRLTLVSD